MKLRFAEISLSGNSARVFNVGFNGTPVLTKFDIYAQAGALTALDKVAPPNVLERTDHAISFSQGSADDWPLVNAIEIASAP